MASIFRPSRRDKWAPFSTQEVVLLAGDDLDTLEAAHERFKNEIRGEVRSVKMLLIGVCFSTTGMAVVGALNYIVLTRGGH